MNLLADENVDEPIIEWLSTIGIDLRSIRHTMPGISDQEVADLARVEDRIILTNDLDFGELIFHRGMSFAGIILLRVRPPLPAVRLLVLRKHWDEIVLKSRGNFIVVTERKIRIRPLQ